MPLNHAVVSRRGVLLAASAAVALGATNVPPSPDRSNGTDKRRSLYQPNAPEVQTFYRVNRYPGH